MPDVSFIAWRLRSSRNFTTTWHLCTDAKWTLCGRRPNGLLTVWRGKKPPVVTHQCAICRDVDARELRNR